MKVEKLVIVSSRRKVMANDAWYMNKRERVINYWCQD